MTKVIKKMNSPTKRRLATKQGVLYDLKDELPMIFKAFSEAHKLYEEEVTLTPPISRGRGFEASLMNSKIIQSIRKYFPEHSTKGKNGRFILRINGNIILFKKLDNNNSPMNIVSKQVVAISNQIQLSLFNNEDSYVEEPILFFGYQKNRFGKILLPKLIYRDEDVVKWIITDEDINTVETIDISKPIIEPAMPKLKLRIIKKASNE